MADRAWLGPNADKTPIPADQTFQEHFLGVALIARRKYLDRELCQPSIPIATATPTNGASS